MLYRIQYDRGYAAERSMIHLVSTAQAAEDAGLDYFLTDGHAIKRLTADFVGLGNLARVDWAVIPLKRWNDTLEDGDSLVISSQAGPAMPRTCICNSPVEVSMVNSISGIG
jgi:ssDNA thymidine ADP-ribosyltransferase, DarT